MTNNSNKFHTFTLKNQHKKPEDIDIQEAENKEFLLKYIQKCFVDVKIDIF